MRPPSVRGPWRTGEIERWHHTLKNRILLETRCPPGALEAAVGAFVDHCNRRRIRESLGNVAPADVYFGRADAILSERRRIKERTLTQRRLLNQQRAA